MRFLKIQKNLYINTQIIKKYVKKCLQVLRKKNSIAFIIILLVFSCKNNEQCNILLKCQNNYDLNRTETLTLFKDSSFKFLTVHNITRSQERDSSLGTYFLKNDSIFLKFQNNLDSNVLLIKDGYVNFMSGETFKMEIVYAEEKNITKKSEINSDSSYSIFRLSKEDLRYYNFKYDTSKIKTYDLTISEFILLKQLCKNFIESNPKELRKYNEYLFQGVCIQNEKNEKEVLIFGYCNDVITRNSFRYYLIDMCDGGNCNIQFKINLNNRQISNVGISGEA